MNHEVSSLACGNRYYAYVYVIVEVFLFSASSSFFHMHALIISWILRGFLLKIFRVLSACCFLPPLPVSPVFCLANPSCACLSDSQPPPSIQGVYRPLPVFSLPLNCNLWSLWKLPIMVLILAVSWLSGILPSLPDVQCPENLLHIFLSFVYFMWENKSYSLCYSVLAGVRCSSLMLKYFQDTVFMEFKWLWIVSGKGQKEPLAAFFGKATKDGSKAFFQKTQFLYTSHCSVVLILCWAWMKVVPQLSCGFI